MFRNIIRGLAGAATHNFIGDILDNLTTFFAEPQRKQVVRRVSDTRPPAVVASHPSKTDPRSPRQVSF